MSVTRRDMLLGGAMAVGAAGALALTPRGRLVLMPPKASLETMVPKTVGSWREMPSDAIVLPKTPGSLADRLYNQQLSRLYVSDSDLPVMLVIAYGEVQNDLLQLHRPETCYSAVGFAISDSRPARIALAPGVALPARDLVARTDSRTEVITYWTRIGDALPTDGSEQRRVKLEQQMEGYLADGVLVRLSTTAEPGPDVFAALSRFGETMIRAMAPANRATLIGRPLAGRIA